MSVSERKFGILQSGESVKIYHLENKSGAYAEVTDFGAILVKVCVPDKDGSLTDVVLGYDDLASYEVNGCFFGATIGRSGNRIGGAKFSIGDKEVVLAQNENDNNLHSGPNGFEKKLWKAAEISQDKNSVVFNRISPDGENGYPGEFDVSVKYEFTEENELKIHYQGVCDEPTIANMTNHSYFNLNGEGSGTAMEQYLTLHAKYYTPVADSHSIPTGVYEEVAGTPMDFRTAKKIGQDIDADFEQLKFVGGYDHNYAICEKPGEMKKMAEAYCDKTGIAMEAETTCCGMQFYAGNFITDPQTGKGGVIYGRRHGFCLESQYCPNAVNDTHFAQPFLKAGEKYDTKTVYRFLVK